MCSRAGEHTIVGMTAPSLLTVSGTVTFLERIAVPAGALVTVKLVAEDGDVLAASAFEAPGVPTAFSLVVDPALVTDPNALQIWATLTSSVGVWGTLELAPVVEGTADVVVRRIDVS
ncbi:hypothetical protein BH09ACT10_BH09ACT10_13290 [soil metagenome]